MRYGMSFAIFLICSAAALAQDDVRVVVGFNGKCRAHIFEKHGGRVKLSGRTFVAGHISAGNIQQLRREALVAYVEEDHVATISLEEDNPNLYGVRAVNAPAVWAGGNTGAGVRVAVLDTGIDAQHADLHSNTIWGANFTGEANQDGHGHGTHVAGTIGAVRDGAGVAGVAPGCSLVAVKVLNNQGSGYYSWIANGIRWAADNGCRVINMSLGGPASDQTMQDAVAYAWGQGVLIVAAGGNGGDGNPDTDEAVSYPGGYADVMAVSAVDSSGALASFTNSGSTIDLAAPGVQILSTYPGNRYAIMSGTSMAAPHVTGVAALAMASGRYADASQVRSGLESGATDLGASGFDHGYGHGLVNAESSAGAVEPPSDLTHDVAIASIGAPSTVTRGMTVGVSVVVTNEGTATESNVSVTLKDGSTTIGTQTATLVPGQALTLNFSWNTFNAAGGVHTLVATVAAVAGETDTADNSGTAAVNVVLPKLHVANIALSVQRYGSTKYARALATVTIVDENGSPVSGATVTVKLTSPFTGTASANTNSAGQVTFVTSWVYGGGTFTVQVTNVAKSGWTYDSSANVETIDSITYRS